MVSDSGARSAGMLAPLLGLSLFAWPGAGLTACDNCPKPDIIMYDFQVNVPRPEPGPGLGEWYDLFYASSRAGATLDTDRQCVRYLAGAALKGDGSGEVGGPLIVGIDHPHLPPAGNIQGRDYLFTGSVDGGPGNYSVTVRLEAACKRRVARSVTGSAPDVEGAKELGRTLTQQHFRPVIETIRAYERRRRDEDTSVAMAGYLAKILSMHPAKRDVKPFETVPIEFTLIDCDGKPLAGRKISLTTGGDKYLLPSYNGKFQSSEVTTNGDGKANADFVVGGKQGVAIPRAQFLFTRPTGCDALAIEETTLNVDATAEFYEVRFTYQQEKEASGDSTEPLPGGSQTFHYREREELNMRCLGVWRNPRESQMEGVIELSGAPEAGCAVSGEYRNVELRTDQAFVSSTASGPGLTGSTLRRSGRQDRLIHGQPNHQQPVDLFFRYKHGDDPETQQFNVSVPFLTQGSVTSGGLETISGGGRTITTPFSDSQSENSDTTFGAGLPDQTYAEERSSIVVTGVQETVSEEAGILTRWSGKLRAVITPVRELASSSVDGR